MKENKKAKLGKLGYIFLGLIVLVIIILFVAYSYITKSSMDVALLNIEEGSVLVDNGGGYVAAQDNMRLGLKDSVKTESGKASIILYESIVISLDANTEVKIEELSKKNIRLSQKSGSTWNKFKSLFGAESLIVETPESVASVRGTTFRVKMNSLLVGEGRVNYEYSGENEDVLGGEKATALQGNIIKGNLTREEKQELIIAIERHIKLLKEVRIREVEKKKLVLNKLLARYGLNPEELDSYFERVDNKEIDLEEVEKKIPFKMESFEKIEAITNEIIAEKETVNRLRLSLN